MSRPFRLRYTDDTGSNILIGRYMGEIGDENNDIEQGQLKNTGGGEYTRCEIKGNKNILDRMPVSSSEFQNNNQEIILDVYSTGSGGWIERDRLTAEHPGTIESNNGEYRNDQLGGFEKWVARQKVQGIGPVNTNVQDVLEEILAQIDKNFVVQTQGTIPSVTNYTFNGNAGQALRDLRRDYPSIKIWFTGQKDGSGNNIVKLEEKGSGSTSTTVTWGETEGYELIEYEPIDTSIVVNQVTVRGTNSNGELIEFDTDSIGGTLGSDIQDSKDEYGEKSLPPRNIAYLEDEAHAEEIAKNLLQLEAEPHLRVALPFQEQNILNTSVGVVDDRFDINDVFTVVKQRDFFQDSKTEVELSFEKNRSERNREERRDLGEERARLYPNTQEDIGSQEIDPQNSNTTTASADISKSGGVDNGNTGVATAQDPATVPISASTFGTVTFNIDVPDDPLANTVIGADVMYSFTNQSGGDMGIRYSIEVNGTEVESGEASSPSDELYVADGDGIVQNFDIGGLNEGDTITIQLTSLDPSTFTADSLFETASGKLFLTDFATAVTTYSEYQIGDDIQFGDNGHGDTTDASTHNLEGVTLQEIIELINEDKTDR